MLLDGENSQAGTAQFIGCGRPSRPHTDHDGIEMFLVRNCLHREGCVLLPDHCPRYQPIPYCSKKLVIIVRVLA